MWSAFWSWGAGPNGDMRVEQTRKTEQVGKMRQAGRIERDERKNREKKHSAWQRPWTRHSAFIIRRIWSCCGS